MDAHAGSQNWRAGVLTGRPAARRSPPSRRSCPPGDLGPRNADAVPRAHLDLALERDDLGRGDGEEEVLGQPATRDAASFDCRENRAASTIGVPSCASADARCGPRGSCGISCLAVARSTSSVLRLFMVGLRSGGCDLQDRPSPPVVCSCSRSMRPFTPRAHEGASRTAIAPPPPRAAVNDSWRTVSSHPAVPSGSVTCRSPRTSTRPKRTVRFASRPERSGPVTVTVGADGIIALATYRAVAARGLRAARLACETSATRPAGTRNACFPASSVERRAMLGP